MTADPVSNEELLLRPPTKARLFCSLIYQEGLVLGEVLDHLCREWGEMEWMSSRFPFSHTSYYEEEMGIPLFRRYLTFEETQEQDALAELKWASIRVERRFARSDGNRKVNIDPGLFLPDKLILATTKPSAHRPYLRRGIYADLTLLFHNRSYRPLPWTYPDYASEDFLGLLNILRNRYRIQRHVVQKTECS
jgi:hypothetical protein